MTALRVDIEALFGKCVFILQEKKRVYYENSHRLVFWKKTDYL